MNGVHVIGRAKAEADARTALELHRRLESVPELHLKLSLNKQLLEALIVAVGREIRPDLTPQQWFDVVLATREEMIVAANIVATEAM